MNSGIKESHLLEDYHYELPPEHIAQEPSEQRDHSRLLVLNRKTGEISHKIFHQVEDFFSRGDVLVINDSRVMKSRLYGKKPTGGRVEVLLLSETAPGRWKGLVRGVAWDKEGLVTFENGPWQARVCVGGNSGVREIQFNRPDVFSLMESHGLMPLPPYIKRTPAPAAPEDRAGDLDSQRYQTVYAGEPGSAAAPTAGLHFTQDLLARLKSKGVSIVSITLHVGYGTFQLIEAADVRDHKIHSEHYSIREESAQTINECRAQGGKVFAVGTTAVRTLENACDVQGQLAAGSGWNQLYICGDYAFKAVDHLITNFHLPKSSLLVLAASFAGRERLLNAYREAIQRGYRFFSYGDAMLIL